MSWRPISEAPSDTLGVIVYARMTCCGGGGRVVMVAGRQNGVWVYPGDHHFEFTDFMELPPPPEDRPESVQ